MLPKVQAFCWCRDWVFSFLFYAICSFNFFSYSSFFFFLFIRKWLFLSNKNHSFLIFKCFLGFNGSKSFSKALSLSFSFCVRAKSSSSLLRRQSIDNIYLLKKLSEIISFIQFLTNVSTKLQSRVSCWLHKI